MPFEDSLKLRFHFLRHGKEFPFASEVEYLAAAEAFMAGAAVEPTKECRRNGGDRLRFNRHTNCFGIERGDGILHTFFKPNARYIAGGFFKWECAKRFDDEV